MKIIQIISYYYPKIGGQENVAREVSERLAKKGHNVEVFTSDIDCPKDKQLKSTKNLKINYLKGFIFANTPILPSLLFKLFKVEKESIFHVHLPRAFIPEFVWFISKLRNIPYIIHFHGEMYSSGRFGFLISLYKKLVLKTILLKARKIICLTEDYKEIVSKEYKINKEKILVIPNGVCEEFFIDKKRNDNKKKNFNLLFVGRLATEKNIFMLIKAISLVKQNITLHLVGEGPQDKEIEMLIKNMKLNNIILYGKKIGKKLINLYKHADIFLLVSDYECLSLVILEAMATGTPIITSDIPGTRSIIKDGYNGILVKKTPEKIAQAIEKIIKNPKLREKLAKNGSREVKKYSWNKIVKQIEEVYKEVLNETNNKKTK